eukprot:gene21075-25298_t
MVEAERQELFCSVDKNLSGTLDFSEFDVAWGVLQKKLVAQTLELMGLTKARVMMAVAAGGFLLLCMFAFIFVGVAAFFGGGALGAGVTTGMCAGTGGGSAASQKEEEVDEDKVAGQLDEQE